MKGIRAAIFTEPFAITQLENGRWLNYSLKLFVSAGKVKRNNECQRKYREKLESLMIYEK